MTSPTSNAVALVERRGTRKRDLLCKTGLHNWSVVSQWTEGRSFMALYACQRCDKRHIGRTDI